MLHEAARLKEAQMREPMQRIFTASEAVLTLRPDLRTACGAAGDWPCPACGANNFARRSQCFRCDEPKCALHQHSCREVL